MLGVAAKILAVEVVTSIDPAHLPCQFACLTCLLCQPTCLASACC